MSAIQTIRHCHSLQSGLLSLCRALSTSSAPGVIGGAAGATGSYPCSATSTTHSSTSHTGAKSIRGHATAAAPKPDDIYDIAIVGGGMVGAAVAALLGKRVGTRREGQCIRRCLIRI